MSNVEQFLETLPIIFGCATFFVGFIFWARSQTEGILAAIATGMIVIPLLAFVSMIVGVTGAFTVAMVVVPFT